MRSILNYLRRRALFIGFWIISITLRRIKYQPLKDFFSKTIDSIKQVFDSLSDDNPDDKKQIKAIVCQNDQAVIKNSIQLLKDVTNESVNSEVAKEEIARILNEVEGEIIKKLDCPEG